MSGTSILQTYSAKDLSFALNSPVGVNILASGIDEKGWNELAIRMTVDQTVLKVGADGAVVPSAIPGQQGEIEIQVWQTSTLHHELLDWYNALITARDSGDVSNWASTTVLITNIVDGTEHMCTGVCPVKVPDKVYGTEAQTMNWMLRASNIANQ